ncbi:DUF6044 family protein [Hymenobacter crusticola]|uniref:YfhO family protein n=1 Tax=Hymenobacter crusticola TaxID=1770526 RepID=A0A243WF26_9BACT|nr:DUF6044 family protein [Hymenobacter crusticola]OUJ74313.1 hypothetical protein BXP70_11390 [Hymenobacter crusticola]
MSISSRFSSPLLLALLGLLVFLLPYLVLGPRSYAIIDDNLDAEISIPYLLTHHHLTLDYRPSAMVQPIMNGLPRNALRSGLSITMPLFAALPPLWAYLGHQVLVRLLGLLGMYALLRRHFFSGAEARSQWLAAGVALAWAVLPLYVIYGLSVAGQPWLLLALLNLRQGPGRWTDWLLIILFPLWSMFVFVGPFVVAGMVGLLLWHAWQGRGVAWRVVAGLVLLTVVYVIVEYPLFYSLLVAKQFVPHRLAFNLAQLGPHGWRAGLKSAAQYFLMGQYHASLFFRGAALLAVGAALVSVPAAGRRTLGREVLPLLTVLAGVALFCGFYPQLVEVVQDRVPALRTFNLSRFHFLTPLLWFVVLVLCLRRLPSARLRGALVGLQLLIGLAMNAEWMANLRSLAGHARPSEPSYQAFIAPRLFAAVQRSIRQQTGQEPAQYRVACLGLPPSVAQLNGFYTLDSYQNNYPLAYKRQFRPLIAGELAKSPVLRIYFDDWGNRCYLLSAELGKNFRVPALPTRTVQDFAFDAAAFRRLGGRYVLSAARLATPERSGLRLVSRFQDPTSYWQLYLYSAERNGVAE